MKFLSLICAAVAAVLLLGCITGCRSVKGIWYSEILNERPVIFAEVMQLKKTDRVYTACNLWINDGKIHSVNRINDGNFLPVGTEIFPGEVTLRSIEFTDADGNHRVIEFNAGMMQMAVEDYIRHTFTTKNLDEMLQGVSQENANAIRSAQIIPGMSRNEVLMCCGIPSPMRTPALTNNTWIYPTARSCVSMRVFFRGDYVREVDDMLE